MDILDATTLQRLQSLQFSQQLFLPLKTLTFSPDSRTLTSFIHCASSESARGIVVSWDLQTGVEVSSFKWDRPGDTEVENAYIVYSMDGRMVAVLCRYESSTVISIYDIVSGVYMHDVHHHTHTNPDLGIPYVYKIWTHGESLRFVTPEPTGITIWEVGFAPGAIPTEVETVLIPDDTAQTVVFESRERSHVAKAEFHPASCRLAFIHTGARRTLLVWDAWASRFLLHYTNFDSSPQMTFSTDGRFFACTTIGSEVCLWKESPTGYTFLEKFASATPYPYPSLSPNGESIIVFGSTTVQLWHTKRFTFSFSSSSSSSSFNPLVQPPKSTGAGFVLEFPPGRPFVVAARRRDQVVTVLGLKTGVPQLTIDTYIDVYGLRQIGNTIVVIGDKKAITWNLPGEDLHPNTRMDFKNSSRTINFGSEYSNTIAASTSPDFQYIALIRRGPAATISQFLDVYCISTGQHLHANTWCGSELWFTPGGRKIWCPHSYVGKVNVLSITQDALDSTSADVDIEDGSWGCPWGSSRGYKVTEDGWILGVGGKRLLMLPPLWRSRYKEHRVWNENFLALLHGELPEVVILELEP